MEEKINKFVEDLKSLCESHKVEIRQVCHEEDRISSITLQEFIVSSSINDERMFHILGPISDTMDRTLDVLKYPEEVQAFKGE